MRLIESQTLRFKEFQGDHDVPPYAILSHTWGEDEVTYQDMLKYLSLFDSDSLQYQPVFNEKDRLLTVPILPMELQGFDKIRQTAKLACANKLDYFWIDTCCIDKKSSAELSEAINSMFRWYQNSVVCYAYLADICSTTFDDGLSKSRWFQRGWTLQELIAPESVIFFNQSWTCVGSKESDVRKIAEFTGIHPRVLQNSVEMFGLSVAQRMCWASTRKTTRVEDIAYCLLGIFDLNMPLLYGEGKKAFIRLQEEIIKRLSDDSIFAWGLPETPEPPRGTLRAPNAISWNSTHLAISPVSFKYCRNVAPGDTLRNSFKVINHGIEMELPVVQLPGPSARFDRGSFWVGLLSCRVCSEPFSGGVEHNTAFLGIFFGSQNTRPNDILRRLDTGLISSATVLVSPKIAARATWKTVTILQDPISMIYRGAMSLPSAIMSYVIFNTKSTEHLGYKVSMGYWTSHPPFEPIVPTTWDTELEMLTFATGHNPSFSSMFHMHSSEDYPPISLIVWAVKNVSLQWVMSLAVRKGRLSDSDGDNIMNTVKRSVVPGQNTVDSQETIFVHTAEGQEGRLTFARKVKPVYQHTIFEININVEGIAM